MKLLLQIYLIGIPISWVLILMLLFVQNRTFNPDFIDSMKDIEYNFNDENHISIYLMALVGSIFWLPVLVILILTGVVQLIRYFICRIFDL